MAATTHSAPLAMVEQLQRPACVGYARGIVRGTIYAFRGGAGFGHGRQMGRRAEGPLLRVQIRVQPQQSQPRHQVRQLRQGAHGSNPRSTPRLLCEERASVQAVLDSDQREAAAAEARGASHDRGGERKTAVGGQSAALGD